MAALMALFLVLDVALEVGPGSHRFCIAAASPCAHGSHGMGCCGWMCNTPHITTLSMLKHHKHSQTIEEKDVKPCSGPALSPLCGP